MTPADLKGFSKEAVVEVTEDYDSTIKEALSAMTGSVKLSDEVQNQFTDLIKVMLDGVSYEVGEATELTEGSASGYTVPVTIKPLKLDVADELQEWAENLEEDESILNDLDGFYEKVFGEVITLLKEAVAKGEYGEEKTINLTVTKNENDLYEIDQNQLTEMGQNLFTTDLTGLTGLE